MIMINNTVSSQKEEKMAENTTQTTQTTQTPAPENPAKPTIKPTAPGGSQPVAEKTHAQPGAKAVKKDQPRLMDLHLTDSMKRVSAEASQIIGNVNQNIEETAKDAQKISSTDVALHVAAALQTYGAYKSYMLMRNRKLTEAVTKSLSAYLIGNPEARTYLEQNAAQETKNMIKQIKDLEEQVEKVKGKGANANKLKKQLDTLKKQFLSQVKPEELEQISQMIEKSKPERVAQARDNVTANRQALGKETTSLFDKMPDSPEKTNLVNGLSKGEYTFRNGAIVSEEVVAGADKFTAQAMRDYQNLDIVKTGYKDLPEYFNEITQDEELRKALGNERSAGRIRIEDGKIVDEKGFLKEHGLDQRANELWNNKYSNQYIKRNEEALNAFMKDFTGTPEEAAKIMEGLKSGTYKYEGGQLVNQKTIMSASDVSKNLGADAAEQFKAYEAAEKQLLDRTEKWLVGAENVKTASEMVAKDFKFIEEYSKAMAAGNTKEMANVLRKMGLAAKMPDKEIERIIKNGNFEEFKAIYEHANAAKASGGLKAWKNSLASKTKSLLTRNAGVVATGLFAGAVLSEFMANSDVFDTSDAEAISNLKNRLGKDFGIKNVKQYTPEEKRKLIDWAIEHASSEEDKRLAQEIKNNGYDIVATLQQQGMLSRDLLVSSNEVAKAYANACKPDVHNAIETMALKNVEDAYNKFKESNNQSEGREKNEGTEVAEPIGGTGVPVQGGQGAGVNGVNGVTGENGENGDKDKQGETGETDDKDKHGENGETGDKDKQDEKDKKTVSLEDLQEAIEIEQKGDEATEEEKQKRAEIIKRLKTHGVDNSVPPEVKQQLEEAGFLPTKDGNNAGSKPDKKGKQPVTISGKQGGSLPINIPNNGTATVPGTTGGISGTGGVSGTGGTVLGPDGKPIKTDDLPMAIAQEENKGFWKKYGTWILAGLGILGLGGLAAWLISRQKKKTKQAKNQASEAQATVDSLTNELNDLKQQVAEKTAADNAANNASGNSADNAATQDSTTSGGTLSDFAQPVTDNAVALINNSNSSSRV